MPLSFNLIASRRRCVCFWHINNQSLWSGIFVVQIYRGSLQIWFKIEQQSISVLWNLTVQHCKLYQNILNISRWRIVITNWNIGNDRVYFESMFASASFPSLVVGKWPCLLEIGSGRRNQQGNHGSKRFYFVCRWRTVCQQVPYIRGAQLWKFTRCPATVYQHTGLQKVDSSFCTLARKNSKIAKWTSPVSREAQLLQASVKIIQNFHEFMEINQVQVITRKRRLGANAEAFICLQRCKKRQACLVSFFLPNCANFWDVDA